MKPIEIRMEIYPALRYQPDFFKWAAFQISNSLIFTSRTYFNSWLIILGAKNLQLEYYSLYAFDLSSVEVYRTNKKLLLMEPDVCMFIL